MATAFRFRSILIVSADDVDKAREAAVQIAPNGEEERACFTIRLSIDGEEPVTHYAADSPVTVDMLRDMGVLITPGPNEIAENIGVELGPTETLLPSLRFYRMNREDVLTATNSSSAQIGQLWSLQAALADAGLQRVQSTLEGPPL